MSVGWKEKKRNDALEFVLVWAQFGSCVWAELTKVTDHRNTRNWGKQGSFLRDSSTTIWCTESLFPSSLLTQYCQAPLPTLNTSDSFLWFPEYPNETEIQSANLLRNAFSPLLYCSHCSILLALFKLLLANNIALYIINRKQAANGVKCGPRGTNS